MKASGTVILIWLAICLSGWGGDVFRHKASGIEFPDRIGTLRMGKPMTVGESGTQVIPYSSKGYEVTVYLRKRTEQEKLTPKEYLAETMSAVREMERRGIYSDIAPVVKIPQQEREDWEREIFRGIADGEKFVSSIRTTFQNGHLVKIRATCERPVKDSLQTEMARLQGVIDGKISEFASACLSQIGAVTKAFEGRGKAKTHRQRITLTNSYQYDQALQEQVMKQYAKHLPDGYKAAIKSSGNMHNPKVQPLRAKFDEMLLKTPTMLKAADELREAGYQIDGVTFEKFWIDTGKKTGEAPRALTGYIALKISGTGE